LKDEGRKRLPLGGAGARRATERGVLLLCLAIKPLSVIATRCHLSPRRGFPASCTIQNLQSYGLCGILDIEKTKSFRKPLLTPQSVGVVFLLLRTIQNLQSYGLCGILDIEKTTAHRGGLPSRLRKIRSVLVKVRGRFFYVRNFFTFCS
jgi:hypothetical protein